MPQRSIVRKRKKARRTKQLAKWRAKQREQGSGKDEKKADAEKAKD